MHIDFLLHEVSNHCSAIGVIERVGWTNQPLLAVHELTSPSFTPTVLQQLTVLATLAATTTHTSTPQSLLQFMQLRFSLYNCKLTKKGFSAHYV